MTSVPPGSPGDMLPPDLPPEMGPPPPDELSTLARIRLRFSARKNETSQWIKDRLEAHRENRLDELTIEEEYCQELGKTILAGAGIEVTNEFGEVLEADPDLRRPRRGYETRIEREASHAGKDLGTARREEDGIERGKSHIAVTANRVPVNKEYTRFRFFPKTRWRRAERRRIHREYDEGHITREEFEHEIEHLSHQDTPHQPYRHVSRDEVIRINDGRHQKRLRRAQNRELGEVRDRTTGGFRARRRQRAMRNLSEKLGREEPEILLPENRARIPKRVPSVGPSLQERMDTPWLREPGADEHEPPHDFSLDELLAMDQPTEAQLNSYLLREPLIDDAALDSLTPEQLEQVRRDGSGNVRVVKHIPAMYRDHLTDDERERMMMTVTLRAMEYSRRKFARDEALKRDADDRLREAYDRAAESVRATRATRPPIITTPEDEDET